MFGAPKKILSLFGFEVRIDISWLILALLVVWSLALGYFPYRYPGLSSASYWLMGVCGAVGLFASIILHELSHSLVARKFGLPISSITLFIFGGVAQMDDLPQTPKAELLMAVAGPLMSIALGLVFYGLGFAVTTFTMSPLIIGILLYLAFINVVLAGFNLIPAFPLDGGRVLRAALWWWRGNVQWATKIASGIGRGFGIFLIIVGVLSFFSRNIIGGVWLFLIGLFIRSASKMSYSQLIMRRAFEGEAVKTFMRPDPITVSPSISIDQLVSDYLYKYHFKMFPVTEGDHLLGYVTIPMIKSVPHERRKETTVGDIMAESDSSNTVSPDDDIIKAIKIMNRSGSGRLLVVHHGKLVGILAQQEIFKIVAIKMDLENE
jgi:Zn-dependent protease/CBS domain-containing protein